VPSSSAPPGIASGPARCRRSSGEAEAVRDLRVLGIALVGAAQIVESAQAAALLAEDGAQILREEHWIPGIGGLGLAWRTAWRGRSPFF